MQSLSEPPSDVPKATLLAQVEKELIAAEKIRVVESKRMGDFTRIMGGDRSRREGR